MIQGFLPINKPKGPTSAHVVAIVRRQLKIKKIGHTGTLDPAAEGVLVLALQKATSLIQYLPTHKTYQAKITLGVITTTLDGEGQVITQKEVPALTLPELEACLQNYVGHIEQIPPMVSACHVDGKRLYDLARQGLVVERKARQVTISKLCLLDYQAPDLSIEVSCSSGTYIRTLADDIGKDLGCGAHLSALLRTETGGLTLAQSLTLSQLEQLAVQGNWKNYIVSPECALAHMPSWTVPSEQEPAARHGQSIDLNEAVISEQPYLVVNHSGKLLGIGCKDGAVMKMKRVLWPANES